MPFISSKESKERYKTKGTDLDVKSSVENINNVITRRKKEKIMQLQNMSRDVTVTNTTLDLGSRSAGVDTQCQAPTTSLLRVALTSNRAL